MSTAIRIVSIIVQARVQRSIVRTADLLQSTTKYGTAVDQTMLTTLGRIARNDFTTDSGIAIAGRTRLLSFVTTTIGDC